MATSQEASAPALVAVAEGFFVSLTDRVEKSKGETMEALDLKTYPWPKVTGLDVAFPTANTDPKLLAEADRRGYSMYSGGNDKPGNKMFSTLWGQGGKIIFRDDVPEDYRKNVYAYLRSLMGSWAPKHEHKYAVCAMLLDEIATGVEEVKKDAKAA
jgi:hypothetical protein